MTLFDEILKQQPYLLADGAMGTNLFKRGLISGDEPALWNITNPDKIASVHQEFITAGSDIVLTNSFGANRFRLKLHNATDKVQESCFTAVNIIKQLQQNCDRRIFIAGDIGPSGELIEPNGALTMAEAIAGFGEQAQALAQAGADSIWIETMSDIKEVEAAYLGAITTNLPVFITMTFDTNGRTMMGITPERAAEFICQLNPQPIALGINCGKSPAESVYSLWQMQQKLLQFPQSPLLIAKANCGIPEYKDGGFKWSGTPESMGLYAKMAFQLGARIIGGCCGTDGPILSAIKDSLDNFHLENNTEITPDMIIKQLGPIPHLNQTRVRKR